jgi:branched-chain amino acid transport system permease protein
MMSSPSAPLARRGTTFGVPVPLAIIVAGLLLAVVPFLHLPAFYESFLYLIFIWIVLATSWNVLSGYSGYFSFGHGAFYGAGIYTTATLASGFGMPFLWTLPIAALVSALLGLGIGAVVFRMSRLRGEAFALLTLAVGYVLATIALNTPIDGGGGVYLIGVDAPHWFANASSDFYVLALVAAIVTLLIAHGVQRSKLGTGLFAIHDDEDVAEVMGVPTFRYKMTAFAISCGLAGVAGGIQALFISYVTVGETFSIIVPLSVVLMCVLGGTRHWLGPAIGAIIVQALFYGFTTTGYPVAGRAAVGVVLIAVTCFLPEGVLGRFTRRRPRAPTAFDAPAPTLAPRPRETSSLAPGEPLLQVRGLVKSFAGLRALDHVDLEVRPGEILGLVGPNGSGKSTLINVVSGHFRRDAGEVLLAGRPLVGIDAHRVARSGIARTYQIPRPFAHLTVLENVALPARFGRDLLSRADALDEARRWLDFTGLRDKADALPEDLNLHQRKFLELARALASRPSLLFLDEVLSGLTPGEIEQALLTVRSIRDLGASIVFVEHVMRAVMALADRIVVLNQGKVIAEGEPVEVMKRREVIDAYLGKAHA